MWSLECGVWSAAPAMQNDDKARQSAAPATKTATHLVKTTQKYCACPTQNDFRHVIKQVGMSQSAAPAKQNDMTTCLETFGKERFCSFPHRHGDATRKPKNRDETCWRLKASISCETSSICHTSYLQNRRFPTSFLMNLKICDLKLDVLWKDSVNFQLHLTKCHACHGICTLSPLDAALTMRFAKSTQHATSKVLRLPRKNDDGRVQSAAPTAKTATHLLKTSPKYCACHTKRLSTGYETRLNVTKSNACHAKRSYATLETSKSDPFAELTIGTAIRPSRERLRTVANGCGRLQTVADVNATSSEHTLNPPTPRVKREPLLRIREKRYKMGITTGT